MGPITIIRVWRGELALWKTFWLFGVGGGLLFGLPIFGALLALTDVPDDHTASIFLFALGFLFVYLAWIFVGIWRSANKYQGDPAWAVLAKIVVAAESLKTILLISAVLFPDIV
ncbi:MAG: hypothetical protein HOB79_17010 [Rhodospirillaceae bacterium]|jgi:hypothetical protein|nr:hypothetical protein [Rhodospirillaceae bacterium]MBT7487873.1 hypothetical protein [Rhodospirillales bacterium]MBT4702773.1 hypothetical protein [Rhodospirillaceae bacterium]MBT5033836.1 hypothetical protein [Rhodospirillaceae bacterium]MBT6220233.1 hypothetical protein [Rhodospirillaceae bacterium]